MEIADQVVGAHRLHPDEIRRVALYLAGRLQDRGARDRWYPRVKVLGRDELLPYYRVSPDTLEGWLEATVARPAGLDVEVDWPEPLGDERVASERVGLHGGPAEESRPLPIHASADALAEPRRWDASSGDALTMGDLRAVSRIVVATALAVSVLTVGLTLVVLSLLSQAYRPEPHVALFVALSGIVLVASFGTALRERHGR
jgi:hypothetical protein